MGSMPVSDHTLERARWLREESARLTAAITALGRLLGRRDMFAPTAASGIRMPALGDIEIQLEKEIRDGDAPSVRHA